MPTSMETPPARPRRTGEHGARAGGRSERVVRDVLRAAAAEIAKSGYVALRVEDVATRAGVNKTTIYRRWPTKAELVQATLRSLYEDNPRPPNTGSLRLDMLELSRRFVAGASTPEGQGIYRMLTAELHIPEVEAFARALRDESFAPWLDVLERAVARGELPPGSDLWLIVEMSRGAVANRLFRLRQPVDDGFLQAVVDIVLLGAKGGGAIRRSPERGERSTNTPEKSERAADTPAQPHAPGPRETAGGSPGRGRPSPALPRPSEGR